MKLYLIHEEGDEHKASQFSKDMNVLLYNFYKN